MMEPRLHEQFKILERIHRRTQFWRELTFCWIAAAVVGLLLLCSHSLTGWNPRYAWGLLALGALVAVIVVRRRNRMRPADFHALALALEREQPELRHLLAAAVEQEPEPESHRFGFLQLRVVTEALLHPQRELCEQNLERKLWFARNAHAAAFAGCLIVWLMLGYGSVRGRPVTGSWFGPEITVTPGDVEMERGLSLVVSARFGRRPPGEATLVVVSASGSTKTIPLARHLSDPVFGAALTEVREDSLYHIEYGTSRTRDYKIRLFDYPALVRADAWLHFPDYTGLTNTLIRDTRRVSAVEGTRLTYVLQLNKTVNSARLIGKDRVLPLEVQSNAVAVLKDFPLTNKLQCSLELVDADGRTNKAPVDFSLLALANEPPELKLTFPRGDQRVTSLQELQLQAEASDDFGLLKYGIGFGVAGQEPQFVELGHGAPANEKRSFQRLIPLEKLGVEAGQVVSYFVWADDYGPDGKVRRSFSDMFFAEIRPFDEIFRSDDSGGAGGSSGEMADQRMKLAEAQKQIVIATWNLQREAAGGKKTLSHENSF
jgi:hypothetical protein